MNINDAVDERLDPVASARGAARYLSHAHGKLSSWPLALTSYNHGIAGMQKARDAVGDDFMSIVHRYDHPKFGFASRNFYAEFLAARDVASEPERYFPEGIHAELPFDWERIVLDVDTPVSELARQYGIDSARLIAMNAAWSEPAKRDQVPLPAGTDVWLPPGMARDADRAAAWLTRRVPARGGSVPSDPPEFGADPD
jgi:membrane-bound lytic murein transglycosylase D